MNKLQPLQFSSWELAVYPNKKRKKF